MYASTDVSKAISLDYLCRDRAQTTTLDNLTGSVLGIEVDHYLRKLVQQSRSPLFTPWAGVSQTLYRTLEHDLNVLQKLDIRPFFVFTGLQVLTQHEIDPNVRLSARMHALNNLERKKNDETVQAFSALTSPSDLAPALRQFLQSKGVEFLVAPYFAGAQLTYMISVSLLDAVYASSDILVYGADRVITDIAFNPSTRVTYCERTTVLSTQLLGLNEDQFLDAYLFAGNEFCPIVPILEPNPPSEFSAYRMRAAADVVRQNGTGYLALNGNPVLEKRPRYMEDWLKARTLFKHHPYINKEGDVVLLKGSKAPNDVARVFGPRLPREIYFYLSRGLIESQTLNSLISGVWKENVPLDGGESRQYRNLLDSLNETRVQCMDLLHGSKQLHHYYEKKIVAFDKWYEDNHSQEIEKLENPLHDDLKKWRIDQGFVDRYCSGSRGMYELLKSLQDDEAVSATLTGVSDAITTIEDVETNTQMRVLQLRGYITGHHTLSPWGKALLQALEGLEDSMSTSVLVIVDMLKLHAVKCETFSARSPTENHEVDATDSSWRLLSRLAAVLPLQQNDAPWQGPIDREALISHSIASTTRRYLASLYELTQLSLLLRGDAKRTTSLVGNVSRARNPFRSQYDAGLAIYVNKYLSSSADIPDQISSQQLFDQLKNTFPVSTDGRADIQSIFELWHALYRAVLSVSSDRQMGAVELKKFERTAQWVAAHH